MGISVFPAPSAASKTMFRTTLISGTSYTVPAGVTYLNVTLVGGGGGGGWASSSTGVTANSGYGGQVISSIVTTTPGASISYAIGAGGAAGVSAGTPDGSAGGNTTFTGATTAEGGNGGKGAARGNTDQKQTGIFSMGGNGGPSTGGGEQGGVGAGGFITVEYWAQEIIMKTFAVIENNKVVNIIVGVEDEVVAANPGKYIEYTNGWDYNNGIDGGVFFPVLEPEETLND